MAEAVMGPLVGRLQELAMSEARAMVAVNNDVRSLRDKLMWMQAFLREAEPRRRVANDELIRVCLQQTRDAVFDAEDAVDQFFLEVDLSRYPNWSRTILKFFSGFTTQVCVRHDLSRRIKSINTRLESIIENKGKYKIDETSDTNSVTPWRPSTGISATAEKLDDFVLPLVGREDQVNQLENALTRKKTERPLVISVTGKSGVGKTKLVKERYEKHLTLRYFKEKAWVTCGPNLSASNIMMLILLRLKDGNVTCSKEDAGDTVHEELKGKGYLLVIDGEVNNTEWNIILSLLPMDKANSRIVRVTQATEEGPQVAGFDRVYIQLNHFEEKDITAELFLATLFMDEKVEQHYVDVVEKDVKEVRAELIFNATGGLPLAVVLLSGLLRTKEYPGEWNKVFEHLGGKCNERRRLENILAMCFDDLPHDLKSCFLYFAGFPSSTLVKARNLVCKWMAEGFLRPKEGKTMEKVGEKYLHELVHRRLMNLPPVENAAPGDERVTVQTRVHDFLVLEAQEANFLEVHSGDDVPTLTTVRRLSLQNHSDKYAALADPLPKLRSILSNFEKEHPKPQGSAAEMKEQTRTMATAACSPFHYKVDSKSKDRVMRKLLQGSQFLRVICLFGLDIGKKLPTEIGDVVHLQYLGITSCSLDEIPPSVGKLTRLQTLDVRGTDIHTLPPEFWRIRTLRHVFGSIPLPRRVGHLEQLQTLQAVRPDDDVGSCWDATTFANMKRLQSLYIWGLHNENVKGALAAIQALKYLVLLRIGGEVISLDFTGFNFPRLQVLVLKGKIVPPLNSPESSNRFYFPTLTKLSLEKTKVSQHFMDKLSVELPLLASLTLLPESYDGEYLELTKGFQRLKELKLDVPLMKIVIEEPACPHLVKLDILIYYLKDFRLELINRPNIEDIIEREYKILHNKMKRLGAFTRKKKIAIEWLEAPAED